MARVAWADKFAGNVRAVISEVQGSGIQTLSGIAAALNARGLTSPRGGGWQATQVKRILMRGSTK
jgi:hypothetical protein